MVSCFLPTMAKTGKTRSEKFHVGCEVRYEVTPPASLFLNIRVRPGPCVRIRREYFQILPKCRSDLILDAPAGNRFDRVCVRTEGEITISYSAEVTVSHRLIPRLSGKSSPEVEGQMLPWLYPSRYCQSDLLSRLAQQKFGRYKAAYDKVRAITDWIHSHVDYVRGATTTATSARDTLTECAGVCRDFAHLGIALCRALSIPARYVTGYAYLLKPPDFHALFEAYVGGEWVLFDATGLAPLNGIIPIGIGRDAADVSLSTTFGSAALRRVVVTAHADEAFHPLKPKPGVIVSLHRQS